MNHVTDGEIWDTDRSPCPRSNRQAVAELKFESNTCTLSHEDERIATELPASVLNYVTTLSSVYLPNVSEENLNPKYIKSFCQDVNEKETSSEQTKDLTIVHRH